MSENIAPIEIEAELQKSYLDYAMSTIVSRSLPDSRDGLKPVHRRILYTMWEKGYGPDTPTKKSARIVGDVMGHYHPHGDVSLYEAMVRMAQNWSMELPLVEGQGNFGNIDGDPPAASRYTEAKLARVSDHLLDDLKYDTVPFGPNYDDSTKEPLVLPVQFPNLLVNGADGIAVGMATKIPPHNLGEVIDATLALLKDPNIPLKALMKFLPGPDFPTGGAVVNPVDLERIYETGRGNISLRGRMTTEDVRRVRKALVITEIPYGVKKTTLVERLADLVKEKKLDGITDIRDESSREGIRVVLELRSAVAVERIATQIYKDSPLEVTFGANMLSLLNGRPETLGLKQALGAFLSFRSEVVKRRTEYQLAEAKARSHVILGYCVATGDMDRIVKLIRASGSPVEARQALMDNKWSIDHLPVDIALLDPGVPVSRGKIQFSEIQARAILDLRLHRLTGLERQELTDELIRLKDLIQSLRDIVEKPQGIPGVIISELKEIRKRFAQPRKTQLGTPEIC